MWRPSQETYRAFGRGVNEKESRYLANRTALSTASVSFTPDGPELARWARHPRVTGIRDGLMRRALAKAPWGDRDGLRTASQQFFRARARLSSHPSSATLRPAVHCAQCVVTEERRGW